MIIILLRHGETDFNKQLKIQGITDNPLNEHGIIDAKSAGEKLKEEYPNITHIYSSNLKRAYHTAEIVKDILGFNGEIIKDKKFQERNFGPYEKMEIIPNMDYSKYLIENVKGFEVNAQLEKRANNAINDIIKSHKKGDIILVSAHSHFIKAFLIGKLKGVTYNSPLANGKFYAIKVTGKEFDFLND